MKNRLTEKIRSTGHVLGTVVQFDSIFSLELTAHAGFDFVMLDWQHGSWNKDTMIAGLRAVDAAGCVAVARLASHAAQDVLWMLDAGYDTLIVPMVNTAEEARALVNACYYPPLGGRSYGNLRAALRQGPAYIDEINDHLLFLPMIETPEAVQSVEDILDIEGVGGCLVGTGDLALCLRKSESASQSMDYDQAVERMLHAALDRDKVAAIHERSAELVRRRLKEGFQFVSCAGDARFFKKGIESFLEELNIQGD